MGAGICNLCYHLPVISIFKKVISYQLYFLYFCFTLDWAWFSVMFIAIYVGRRYDLWIAFGERLEGHDGMKFRLKNPQRSAERSVYLVRSGGFWESRGLRIPGKQRIAVPLRWAVGQMWNTNLNT